MEHGDLIQLLLSGVLLGAVLSVAAAEGAEPTAPALRASRFGDGLRRPRSHAPRISRRPRERNMKFERIEPEAVEQLQKPKSTGVWIYSSAPGDSLDCGGGPQGGTGGAALTWAAQHWRVYVAGHGTYQAGGNPNQARFIKGAAENSAGRIRVGETQKTAGEMDRWVDEWNKGDGAKEFNVVTNNCQTFARRFAEFLCEGNSNLPDHAGVAASIGDGFLSAAAGIGCFLQYWPNDNVSAEIGKAGAEARVGWAGARLAAEASLAAIHMQTSTGNDIVDGNLRVQAEGPAARACARVEPTLGWVAASAGAYAAEVSAGPFAARAGVKFGGGFENGIPVVHAGPVSCIVM